MEKHWNTLNWITRLMEDNQNEIRNRYRLELEHEKQLEKREAWENMEEGEKKTTIKKMENKGDGTEEDKKACRLEQAKLMKQEWKARNDEKN